MGVVNITPDSFSGDGLGKNGDRALEQALYFQSCGVDLIDVGGESTRPSSVYSDVKPITIKEETDRVIPVIATLKKRLDIPISIDSRRAVVVREAFNVGVDIINDVSMMNYDFDMIDTVCDLNIPFILTHNKQIDQKQDVIVSIKKDFKKSINKLDQKGFDLSKLIIDPGIGFGKTADQSISIINDLNQLKLGFPVLIGTSRKSHIGKVLNLPVSERLEGTAATVAISIDRGADIIRVHDVKEMIRVAQMTDAITRRRNSG